MVNKTIMQGGGDGGAQLEVLPEELCLDILMGMLENMEGYRIRTLVSGRPSRLRRR